MITWMHSTENEDPFVRIANLIGGEEYHKVARALLNTEDATDEEIAGATGMRINIIRKVLYEKGWFVYRWRAKRDQAENFIENQKKKILDRLQKRLEYEESSEFYHCGNTNCPRIKFDYAMELFFKCPNCKNSLNMVNNEKVKDALRFKIEQILLDIGSKDEISS
jgi:transcription initiation factor TFIIE subunit alpha